ncbi:spore germination protein, partial [Streptococcus suis]
MELTLEMLREAGVRLPTPIGQTVGIVGGIVIGQAVVQAGIVSNIMVIVVAFTAISSF